MSDKKVDAMGPISRRSILKFGGVTVASAFAGRAVAAVSGVPPAVMMTPAPRADVTMLDGPMLEQFRAHHATLLAMDEDALLKPFRSAAGLSAPGEDLGG